MPSIEDLTAERTLLNQAFKALEGQVSFEEIQVLAQDVLQSRGVFFQTKQDQAISAAVAVLAYQDPTSFTFELEGPFVNKGEQISTTLAYIWTRFVSGLPVDLSILDCVRELLGQVNPNEAGAINLLSLSQWFAAMDSLLQGDIPAARKFWKRSLTIGAQFGTDSHGLISWAFVSTFLQGSIALILQSTSHKGPNSLRIPSR